MVVDESQAGGRNESSRRALAVSSADCVSNELLCRSQAAFTLCGPVSHNVFSGAGHFGGE